MNLFYQHSLAENATTVAFEKDESRHIVKALRKKTGDILHITNGKGWLFTSKLTAVSPKSCEATILKKEKQMAPNYHLHIAVAPTKNNDRFEWFLEKATEIGIHQITPIYSENSERNTIKPDRLERIIVSAMKQSLNCYKPQLNTACSLSDFLNDVDFSNANTFIAHCHEGVKEKLHSILPPKKPVVILIGPEGDFSIQEVERAIKAGYIPITLSNSRLRTETAAIAACHTVSLINFT